MNRQDDLDFLAYIVKDSYALFEYKDVLKHYHFRDRNARTLFSLVSGIAEDNKEIPTYREMCWVLESGEIASIAELSPLEKQHLLRDLTDVYESDITKQTGNRVRKFIAERTFMHMGNKLSESSYTNVEAIKNTLMSTRQRIEKLDELMSPVQNNPIQFPLSLKAINEIPRTLAGLHDQDVIPTPYERFNAVTGGGFHKGETSLLVGLTGTGKTTNLLQYAMHCANLKRVCVMYSLDDSDLNIKNRIYCYTAGISSEGIELNELTQRVLMNTREEGNPYFVLRCFPRRMITPEFIRRDLQRIRIHYERIAEELNWDDTPPVELVVVDYLDVLKLGNGKELRHRLEDTSNRLGTLAGQENIHVATATQSNAKGMKQDVLHEGNIAEGFSKSWACKLGIAICGSQAEIKGGRMRLGLFKNTWGPSGYINPCQVNWEKMRITETIGDTLIPINHVAKESKDSFKSDKSKTTKNIDPEVQNKLQRSLGGLEGVGNAVG